MITSLKIRGYRGFTDFAANDLGRVNLLVGKNNSGKTAFLEAVEFLTGDVDPVSRLTIPLGRREETVRDDLEEGESGMAGYDICHLFNMHRIDIGSTIEIQAATEEGSKIASCTVVEITPQQLLPFSTSGTTGDEAPGRLGIRVEPVEKGLPEVVPLSPRGILDSRLLRFLQPAYASGFVPRRVVFISPSSLTAKTTAHYWGKVALTQEEEFVIGALKIVEPLIEQLAYIGPQRGGSIGGRGVMAAKLRGMEQRIPLGSLGDGVWRLLALALALVRSRNGFLLVDEIDTGLHHTTMTDMWKMILGAAERLNVQVFATTHSFDCVSSLAPLCDPEGGNKISVQRIDPAKPVAVSYSEGEIKVVAERNIEVR
jgi:hypothetical protein